MRRCHALAADKEPLAAQEPGGQAKTETAQLAELVRRPAKNLTVAGRVAREWQETEA